MKRRVTILSAAAALLLPAGLAAQPQPDLGTEEQRAAGELVYAKYCSQCHGDDGAGQGIAAPFLRPAPRDFTSAKYRIRSTPTGYLPTDEDLRRSIREVERTASIGHRGINLCMRPEDHGAPPLRDRHWDPLWSSIQETGLPVSFHIGGGDTSGVVDELRLDIAKGGILVRLDQF